MRKSSTWRLSPSLILVENPKTSKYPSTAKSIGCDYDNEINVVETRQGIRPCTGRRQLQPVSSPRHTRSALLSLVLQYNRADFGCEFDTIGELNCHALVWVGQITKADVRRVAYWKSHWFRSVCKFVTALTFDSLVSHGLLLHGDIDVRYRHSNSWSWQIPTY